VIEYVDDLDECLSLFARLLKPGAVLILSMPNLFSVSRAYERAKYWLNGKPPIYRYVRHFTSPAFLARLVRRHGLVIEHVRYYAHNTRLARLARHLLFPAALTEDLFGGFPAA
jgi:hypothetical protein